MTLFQTIRPFTAWLRARPLVSVLGLLVVALAVSAVAFARRSAIAEGLTAVVHRGGLVVRLVETGTLRPTQSLTYRSPLAGREAEIVFLAPEGTRVQEGDLLVRLDTTELQQELERAGQTLRQAQIELKVAEADRQEAEANLESVTEGEGALEVEEARSTLRVAEAKVERLRTEYESLQPLLEKGFATRDELERVRFELEQASAEVQLARRRTELFVERTYPREKQRARLLVAQREAQLQNARARVEEAERLARALRGAIGACSLYARRPGLVVYEDYLAFSPRRKIRVGDRVTPSQGLVTIPEVNQMLVETSVREADVHRVRRGLSAVVAVDAFPNLRLSGTVLSVGALARSSAERPFEEKRFDLVVGMDQTDAELRPEMTARVEILVGERRNVLLIPINAVFDQQGVPVVHVVGSWSTETRPVEVGVSDDRYVEVMSGVREGERVALVDVVAPASAPAVSPGGDFQAAPETPKGGSDLRAPRRARASQRLAPAESASKTPSQSGCHFLRPDRAEPGHRDANAARPRERLHDHNGRTIGED